jgi:hypothetical protein
VGRAKALPQNLSGVFRRVVLGGFFGVVFRLHVMTVREMGVVAGLFVVARFVMLGRGQMLLRRMLMMFRRLTMMFSALFRHGFSRFRSEMQNRVLYRLRAYPRLVTAVLQVYCKSTAWQRCRSLYR